MRKGIRRFPCLFVLFSKSNVILGNFAIYAQWVRVYYLIEKKIPVRLLGDYIIVQYIKSSFKFMATYNMTVFFFFTDNSPRGFRVSFGKKEIGVDLVPFNERNHVIFFYFLPCLSSTPVSRRPLTKSDRGISRSFPGFITQLN